MTKSMIVFGAQGQLGSSLMAAAAEAGWRLKGYDKEDASFTDLDAVADLAGRGDADIIVNAAAYTAVDKAETEAELAHALNALAPEQLARSAAARGVPIVHVSTDYVFDGASDAPYGEDATPNPRTVYGRTKLDGEQRVAAANPHHVILRTAWLFSPFGANFVKTMLRLAETRHEIGVVDDQFGGPTAAADLASAIFAVADVLTQGRAPAQAFGTFHFAGRPHVSWADFAEAVFEAAGPRLAARPGVKRIGTSDYPTAAERPPNSRLLTDKITSVYGVNAPDWRPALASAVAKVLDEKAVSPG